MLLEFRHYLGISDSSRYVQDQTDAWVEVGLIAVPLAAAMFAIVATFGPLFQGDSRSGRDTEELVRSITTILLAIDASAWVFVGAFIAVTLWGGIPAIYSVFFVVALQVVSAVSRNIEMLPGNRSLARYRLNLVRRSFKIERSEAAQYRRYARRQGLLPGDFRSWRELDDNVTWDWFRRESRRVLRWPLAIFIVVFLALTPVLAICSSFLVYPTISIKDSAAAWGIQWVLFAFLSAFGVAWFLDPIRLVPVFIRSGFGWFLALVQFSAGVTLLLLFRLHGVAGVFILAVAIFYSICLLWIFVRYRVAGQRWSYMGVIKRIRGLRERESWLREMLSVSERSNLVSGGASAPPA
ncbi:hypothetical protein [Pseudoclavibacter helvolus]|uniref:hypothetical protein n=1 Tax=Pseudoclavibacter helvolus TaxID=255205 RepID=UPI0012E7E52E|nr:hypothetical protein [Pseudoclavibacter helvolus]